MKLTIATFAGQFPKLAPHLLPASGAQQATNTRATSGSLRALNSPSALAATIVVSAQSIFSLGAPGLSVILSWTTDVDVARSPISDSEYKIYYTDAVAAKKTSYTLATSGAVPYPFAYYLMGTPAPLTAPTLGTTAGSIGSGTYAYIFTYITQFGTTLLEESAPSPAANVTLGAPGGVTITFPSNPSTTNRNYISKRVYRASATTYQMVADVPFANGSYTDAASSASIPGTALPSLGWLPPADDLKGICSLPSGALVGFRNNEVWFSEPGFPHAWPLKYMQALDAPIVAIKAFGNNVAVATTQYPFIGTGVYPDSFTFTKLQMQEPCVSKRSMASDEEGAVYASNNGLVSIGLNGMTLLTATELTRQEMFSLTPSSMMGIVFENRYYGFISFTDRFGTVNRAVVVGREEGVGLRYVEIGATAATVEPTTAQMFYVDKTSNTVASMDPTSTVPMTYVWKSKRFQLPAPVNFSCFQVMAPSLTEAQASAAAAVITANAVIIAANAAAFAAGALLSEINASELNTIEVNGSALQPLLPTIGAIIVVSVFASSVLKYSASVLPNLMYRLPSGFKSNDWTVQMTGQNEVTGFEMATSTAELRAS